MPTNSLIDRGKAAALIPEDAATEIIKAATEESVLLRLGKKRRNMARAQQRLPILGSKPTAYFVNGDTGLKQTTDVDWDNIFLNAEPLAVIVPIPEEVEEDTDYNLTEELMPEIIEAFGVAIDAAMLHGTNKPSSWPTAIVPGAIAASHSVTLGTGADLYDDLLSTGGVLSLVEEDGFMPNGHVAAPTMAARYRGVRSSEGEPIFKENMQGATQYALNGGPLYFPRNGALDPAVALQVSGDWDFLQYAIRTDMRVKRFTEGVIQDNSGSTILNLMQQDSSALRFTMRIAFVVPNPPNRLNPTEATRYPFAVLTP